jgi:hypothetical protein
VHERGHEQVSEQVRKQMEQTCLSSSRACCPLPCLMLALPSLSRPEICRLACQKTTRGFVYTLIACSFTVHQSQDHIYRSTGRSSVHHLSIAKLVMQHTAYDKNFCWQRAGDACNGLLQTLAEAKLLTVLALHLERQQQS